MDSRTLSQGRVLALGVMWVALSCTACGGGGGGSDSGPSSQPHTFAITSTAALDGYIESDWAISPHYGIYVGDYDGTVNGRGCRGFVTFDLSSIPTGSTIDAATFEIMQLSAVGNAFSNHGDLYAWRVDIGDSFEWSDYDTHADQGIRLSQSVAPGIRSVSMRPAVRDTWANGGTQIQFRLQFRDQDSDSDFVDDGLWFEDGEASHLSGSPPRLVVTYTPP